MKNKLNTTAFLITRKKGKIKVADMSKITGDLGKYWIGRKIWNFEKSTANKSNECQFCTNESYMLESLPWSIPKIYYRTKQIVNQFSHCTQQKTCLWVYCHFIFCCKTILHVDENRNEAWFSTPHLYVFLIFYMHQVLQN